MNTTPTCPRTDQGIMGKVPGTRNDGERKALQDYKDKGSKLLWRLPIAETAIYAVAIHPAGKMRGGRRRRRHRAADRRRERQDRQAVFPRADRRAGSCRGGAGSRRRRPRPAEPLASETLPSGVKVLQLDVQPAEIVLNDRLRTTPAFGHGTARLGRDGRRHSDGRGRISSAGRQVVADGACSAARRTARRN